MRPAASSVVGGGPPPSARLLGFLLALVLFVPTLMLYVGLATSMALGACVVASVVIVASLAERPTFGIRRQQLSVGTLILLVLTIIVFHLTIAISARPLDLPRATLSIIVLVLILVSGVGLGHLLDASCGLAMERAVYVCLGLMGVLGLLALSGFVPPNSEAYFKPVFPYTEPSHFALSFLPLLMFACVRLNGSAKIAMLFSGLAMGWALESLTLIVGWFLIASICLRKTSIALVLAVLALLSTQLDLSYYLDRLNFAGADQNLSTLVYLQGWQLIDESLRQSAGWGIGFQQLGVQGSNVEAADLIVAMLGENANLLDGGFTFAKITSEFGVCGLLLMFGYLAMTWRCVRSLRRSSRDSRKGPSAVALARCILVSFLVELFVRGEGYFSGTTLLLTAAITILSLQPSMAAEDAHARKGRPSRRATANGMSDLACEGQTA